MIRECTIAWARRRERGAGEGCLEKTEGDRRRHDATEKIRFRTIAASRDEQLGILRGCLGMQERVGLRYC